MQAWRLISEEIRFSVSENRICLQIDSLIDLPSITPVDWNQAYQELISAYPFYTLPLSRFC